MNQSFSFFVGNYDPVMAPASDGGAVAAVAAAAAAAAADHSTPESGDQSSSKNTGTLTQNTRPNKVQAFLTQIYKLRTSWT